MYEMYPEAWTVFDDRHQATGHQPRRRARTEHSVVPAILAQAQKAGPTRG
jgi:hemoglobin-like flavoprotein